MPREWSYRKIPQCEGCSIKGSCPLKKMAEIWNILVLYLWVFGHEFQWWEVDLDLKCLMEGLQVWSPQEFCGRGTYLVVCTAPTFCRCIGAGAPCKGTVGCPVPSVSRYKSYIHCLHPSPHHAWDGPTEKRRCMIKLYDIVSQQA